MRPLNFWGADDGVAFEVRKVVHAVHLIDDLDGDIDE